MHKAIKRFEMEGIVGDDATFGRTRDYFESQIIRDMRDAGYVPVLDLGPYWSTTFVKEKKHYLFRLSVYGVSVGRRKAWQIEGMMNGKALPRHTTQSKSKPSSEPAE